MVRCFAAIPCAKVSKSAPDAKQTTGRLRYLARICDKVWRRFSAPFVFTVNVWNPEGPERESLWQVMGRTKDIQFASRATSHIARLVAPKLEGEDHTKDIDFTPTGIRARWQSGYVDARRMLERAPWTAPVDPMDGVVIHDPAVRGKRQSSFSSGGTGR